jgi:hypothetical protein
MKTKLMLRGLTTAVSMVLSCAVCALGQAAPGGASATTLRAPSGHGRQGKPLPPFPIAHGVTVKRGVPPSIILSENAKAEPRTYHVGDTAGGFVIAAITEQKVVLKWDGRDFEKRIADLEDHGAPAAAALPVATNEHPASANGPGAQISSIERACVKGDTNPVGTVVDGYRKQIALTPMGKSCAWVKADQ